MSMGENQSRFSWLRNRTKLTIALAVAGALVLGGGAASAVVMSQQMAAAEQAEAERLYTAAIEYETAFLEHKQTVTAGNALVKDMRASLLVSGTFLDQATIDEASRLVEYLAIKLAASKPPATTTEMQDEIDALATAIADAWAGIENASALAAAAGESRLAAANLADEAIRQKVADSLAALAASLESRKGTSDALASLAAAVKSAEASHGSVVAAQDAAAKEAEKKAAAKEATTTKPKTGTTEKDKTDVDKTGWYTHAEASQAIVSAWGAVAWHSGCAHEKKGDGYWYRSGGSPSTPPVPPAVDNFVGFKVQIINAEKAWVYYYDCP